jgi:hypothetical protein
LLEDIKGFLVTLENTVGFRGPVVFSAYINALRTNGHEIEAAMDQMDDIEDLFWLASDELGLLVYDLLEITGKVVIYAQHRID